MNAGDNIYFSPKVGGKWKEDFFFFFFGKKEDFMTDPFYSLIR